MILAINSEQNLSTVSHNIYKYVLAYKGIDMIPYRHLESF